MKNPWAKNIFVAEGDPAYSRLISAALHAEGHRVTTAASVRDLRDALHKASRVDLVLADASLADLANLPGQVPLILMTSRLTGRLRRVAKALGATTSIHRPIYPDELKRAVSATPPRPPRPAEAHAGTPLAPLASAA